MKITLKSLDIKNFKGIETKSIEFSDRVKISGRNATGKSTIQDSFLWCLFGKDSSGASDFSVKPKFPDGKDKPHLDVDVMCILDIDGRRVSLRRRLVEKWSTPRGGSEPEFKGNTGEFFVNDVPVSATEYGKQISSICDEEMFKLVTTAGAFNKMKDADRRRILSAMAGDVSDLDLAVDFPAVLEALKQGKTVQQYRDEIKHNKKRVVDEKEQYPARLKENADMRPYPVDFAAFAKAEKDTIADIAEIDKKLSASTGDLFAQQEKERVSKEIKDLDNQIEEISQSLTRERNQKKLDLESKLSELRYELEKAKQRKSHLEDQRHYFHDNIESHERTMQKIREDWKRENSRTCEASVDSQCPTCGTVFDETTLVEKKNDIVKAFNEEKLKRLEEIRNRGNSESEYIAKLKEDKEKVDGELSSISLQLEEVEKSIKETERKISELPTVLYLLSASLEHQNLKNRRDELIVSLNVEIEPDKAAEELKAKKAQLEITLSEIRKELSKKGEIERADQRKQELLDRQAELGQKVAEYEGIEHQILQFSMRKTAVIEEAVAGKFKFVKWRLFEENITNDGIREVCVCMVNGTPYHDLNTAMKINADLDILNTLSQHYSVFSPVFVDGAESINAIEDISVQRIDLYVTDTDAVLRVENL